MPRVTTTTPTFTPIGFEQYLKPMEAYVDTYNTLNADIDTTQSIIDTIPQFLDENNAGDAELLKVYNTFTSDKEKVADAISRGNLKDMMSLARGLKQRYNRELAPIASAYQKKQEAVKAWDDRYSKDGTIIGTDPRGRSVKDWLNGASPSDYFVSGASLYNQGATDAKAESARRVITEAYTLSPELMNQYFVRGTDTGFKDFDSATIARRVLEGTGATEKDTTTLRDALDYVVEAVDRIGKANNISKLGEGSENYKTAQAWLLNGILSGVGYSRSEELKDNKAFLDAADRARLQGLQYDNEIKRRALFGEDPELPQEPNYSDVRSFITPEANLAKEEEFMNILGELKSGRKKPEDETGRKVADTTPRSQGYAAQRAETYLDKLFELAKAIGYTDKSTKFEDFKKAVNDISFEQTIASIEDRIKQNASLYREYYLNASTTDQLTRRVNAKNAGYKDRKNPNKASSSSLIWLDKGNGKKEPALEVPNNVTITVPIPSHGKDLIFTELGGDNNTYYVKPEAYEGTIVSLRTEQGLIPISIKDAINLYQELVNERDSDAATYVAQSIINAIAGTSQGALKQQGTTISTKDLIVN